MPSSPSTSHFHPIDRRLRRFAGFAVPVLATLVAAARAVPAQAAEGTRVTEDAAYFHGTVEPLLGKYCTGCHSTEKPKGDLDLERFDTIDAVLSESTVWIRAAEQIEDGEMPPEDERQPSDAEKETIARWIRDMLDRIARSRAGDPGPVVLRRLSNAEYTYTLRDLTGVESLDPAREFPADGAAGEGFMNAGEALAMSPSLVAKYLDAGKEVASHAVLLPDGIRFSPRTSRRDWTNEILAKIQEFYARFTDPGGATRVNLQGIVYDTNAGGRLPVEAYLRASIEERQAIAAGSTTIEEAAAPRGLSPRYLARLIEVLEAPDDPSPLLAPLRQRWRNAVPDDAPALAAEIARWQDALWKFNSVGHIGKVGGPTAWMEPVTPLVERREFRIPMPGAAEGGNEVIVHLAATTAGDPGEGDRVVWSRPRLTAPGRPDLLLRDVRGVTRRLAQLREQIFANTAACLKAAAEAESLPGPVDVPELSAKHSIDPAALESWLDYLGIGTSGATTIAGHFTTTFDSGSGYDFIKGWGGAETPNLVANASDQAVRIPGNMLPHSIAVHPSPTLRAAVGWQCPVPGSFTVQATIRHAHPECGNGVTWTLELRRGTIRQRLASGIAHGGNDETAGPVDDLAIQKGDVVSLLIGPRDGNHSCDLTTVELRIAQHDAPGREWSLWKDVAPSVLAGNPHADGFGNPGVWHFYTEPDDGSGAGGAVVPPGSLLARWMTAPPDERPALAVQVQELLRAGAPVPPDSPDAQLHRQLASLGGPLFRAALQATTRPNHDRPEHANAEPADAAAAWGLDPAMFPDGGADLIVTAPSVVSIRLPADLVEGCEFVVEGSLDTAGPGDGSVQLQASRGLPDQPPVVEGIPLLAEHPVVVGTGTAAAAGMSAAFDSFRDLFPAALCYGEIVPVDEVITLTLFHREDGHLRRLMLDDAEAAELDRLWDELRFVSQDALTMVDAFAQLMEYATQDADPSVFEPLRQPIRERAAAFRDRLAAAEPAQLDAVVAFAGAAFRRPTTEAENANLRALYRQLRSEELAHDEAIRLLIARTLVAPAFLYRPEASPPGTGQAAVSGFEFATRLSYFLWSSAPDAELLALAASGELTADPAVAVAQARRMLRDDRARRLATEFACVWLHVHGFDSLDEKSERHFPTFAGLRGAMYEETIRFFTDLFQRDGSVLEILDADHAFVNAELAEHYGIPGVEDGGWRRIDGVRALGRGGILGQATTLAKQSGASRTSPILRGNWITEVLLGERLPRPPKDVPQLPDDETDTAGLTMRQLVEKHSSDPKCSGCHLRIDAYGFALEDYDAIGRRRDQDLGGRAIDTRVRTPDGVEIEGLAGLRHYLLDRRRDDFLEQFCRKLLGYALGRSIQLSDQPLLDEMVAALHADGYRIGSAVESIVRSPQFRDIRCLDSVYSN